MDNNLELGGRISAIDHFRGVTMIIMIFVNYLAGVELIPAWLKHAPDIGLTITDIVAPAFIFAIGLTYKASFDRRSARYGLGKAYYDFITRFLAIMGLGAFFTGGASIVASSEATGSWGVLQAIGMAGLMCLAFIRTGTIIRFVVSAMLLIIYQFMLERFWLNTVLNSAQGGLEASFSWCAMLLLSTVLADLHHIVKWNRLIYAASSTAILITGLLASLMFPISKHRVSISYVLISIGISAIVFYFFSLLADKKGLKLALLVWWGKNPLAVYIFHLILLGVTFLPGSEIWYAKAPLWFAFCQLTIFTTIITFVAWWMHSHKIFLKL